MAVQPVWKPPLMVIHNSRKQVNLLFNSFHRQAVSPYLAHFPSKSHYIYDICQSSSAAILKMRPLFLPQFWCRRAWCKDSLATIMLELQSGWLPIGKYQYSLFSCFLGFHPSLLKSRCTGISPLFHCAFQMDWLSPLIVKTQFEYNKARLKAYTMMMGSTNKQVFFCIYCTHKLMVCWVVSSCKGTDSFPQKLLVTLSISIMQIKSLLFRVIKILPLIQSKLWVSRNSSCSIN